MRCLTIESVGTHGVRAPCASHRAPHRAVIARLDRAIQRAGGGLELKACSAAVRPSPACGGGPGWGCRIGSGCLLGSQFSPTRRALSSASTPPRAGEVQLRPRSDQTHWPLRLFRRLRRRVRAILHRRMRRGETGASLAEQFFAQRARLVGFLVAPAPN